MPDIVDAAADVAIGFVLKHLNSDEATKALNDPIDRASKAVDILNKKLAEGNKLLELRKTPLGSALITDRDVQKVQEFNKSAQAALNLKPPPTGVIGFFANFNQSLETLDKTMQRAGFSFRGISVLLGAGLAGGLTGVVRITEKVIETVSKFIGEERELSEQTEKTFGDAARDVEAFSTTVAREFGANRDEALKTLNTFAALGRELQLPEGSLKNFSELLQIITDEAFATNGGFKNIEDAGKAVESAIKGDTGALAKLGISMHDVANASREMFGKLPDELTDAEKGFLNVAVAAKEANAEIDKGGHISESAWHKVLDFFKAFVSGGPAPSQLENFNAVLDDINRNLINTGSLADSVWGFIEGRNRDNRESIKNFKQEIGDLTAAQLDQLLAAAREKEAQGDTSDSTEAATAAIEAEIAARKRKHAAVQDGLTDFQKERDLQEANLQLLEDSSTEQQKALNLIESMETAQNNLAKSQRHLSDLQKDSAREYQDLLTQNKRAIDDADRALQDAERNLQQAIQDRSSKVAEANLQFSEAIDHANRSVRSANEKLQDDELAHTRKLEDLSDRTKKAKASEAKSLIEDELAVAAALLKGDEAAFNAAQVKLAEAKKSQGSNGELANAQRDIAREQQDFAKQHLRDVRAVKEAEIDAARNIAEAHITHDKAIRDADRALARASEELDKAKIARDRVLEDSEKRLTDFEIKRSRALLEANEAIKNNAIALDKATRAAQEYAHKVGFDDVNALRAFVNELINLNEIWGIIGQNLDINAVLGITLPQPPPGGMGGGFFSGPFIAGEGGMSELIIPTGGGAQVVSHRDLIKTMREASSGGGHHFTIIDNTGNAEAVAEAVMARSVRGVG